MRRGRPHRRGPYGASVPDRLARGAQGGLTLVEVMVALTVLALVGAALASVQLGALRSSRSAQVRQRAGALLADEMTFQRLHAGLVPGACVSAADLPAGWRCSAEQNCHAAVPDCRLTLFEVRIEPPQGEALTGRGAAYAPLVGRP